MSCTVSAVVQAGVLLLSPAGVLPATQREDARLDQQAIVRQLLSESPDERRDGVAAASMIAPQDSGRELRAALIALLVRQNEIAARAEQARVPLSTLADPEFVAAVHHAVAAFRDPAAIPALANALGNFTVLNEPDLRRTLESLATVPEESVARGVTDPRLIEQTGRRAADRLKRVPALPRPHWNP